MIAAPRQVQTREGIRFVAKIEVGETFWALYKSSQKPPWLSCSRFRGSWNGSVWGATEAECQEHCVELRALLASTVIPVRPARNGGRGEPCAECGERPGKIMRQDSSGISGMVCYRCSKLGVEGPERMAPGGKD